MTSILRIPGFARAWVAGGIANAMLWLELLAAALFTLSATGSPLAVAVVSAARAAPLLLVGAVVGVLADAADRRRIVLLGLLLTAASSATVAILAASGVLLPWHLAVSALVSGLVYATEMPARRRLVADLAGAQAGRAIAMDSLTNFATRCAGPLVGGIAVGGIGVAGTYAASAACSLVGAALVGGLAHRQAGTGSLTLPRAREDLVEGLAYARRSATVATLLAVTVAMNLFGYSYTGLIAPVGHGLGLADPQIGVLAAAEPGGALLAGLLMVRLSLPGPALGWLGGGSAMLLAALACVPLVPPLWPACLVLALGGFGVAAYTNVQTTVAVQSAPPALQSRVLGLVSMCVGCWPLGQVLAGGLATWLGPLGALAALALGGLVSLGGIAAFRARADPAKLAA